MRVVSARFVAGARFPSQFPKASLPEVAFAGRSNVGKSTLLNRVAGRRMLARVSKRPGRTQQLNFFHLNDHLCLVDLPGYGFARVPRAVQEQWRTLVESYLSSRPTLKGAVVLVDARRGVEADDALLLDFLSARRIPAVLAVTKSDKLKRSERRKRFEEIAKQQPRIRRIACSGATGEGVRELLGAVSAMARGC